MQIERTATRLDGVRIVTETGPPCAATERAEARVRQLVEDEGMRFRDTIVTEHTTLQMSPYDDLDAGLVSEPRDDLEAVVFVTEMPRVRGRQVVVAEVDHQRSAAVISVPSLGPLPGRALATCIAAIIARLRGRSNRGTGPTVGRWVSDDGDGSTEYLVCGGAVSRARVVLGMVGGNRPWRLIPTLTGLTAAAAAAASFGIFFSSIWSMANSLSAWRLSAISLLSVALTTAWLIVNNKLWERRGDMSKWRARLFNTVTVCTVLFSSVVLYVGLFVATLVAALFVIDSSFMADQLGFPVNVGNYVLLAWLATSMGMFAGGLGSSADSYDDVLRATYGHRERKRRRRAGK
ncbi:hypothetical protein [Gordonia insulae]|nr:hypothetical protein [Gordonia insulae]